MPEKRSGGEYSFSHPRPPADTGIRRPPARDTAVDLDALKRRLGIDRVLKPRVESPSPIPTIDIPDPDAFEAEMTDWLGWETDETPSVDVIAEDISPSVDSDAVFGDDIDFLAGLPKLDIQQGYLITKNTDGTPLWFPLDRPASSGAVGTIYRLEGGTIIKKITRPPAVTHEQFHAIVRAEYETLRSVRGLPHVASIEAAGLVDLPNGEQEYYIQMPDGGKSFADYTAVSWLSDMESALRTEYPEHAWLFDRLAPVIEGQRRVEKMKESYLSRVPDDVQKIEQWFVELKKPYKEELHALRLLFYDTAVQKLQPAVDGTHALHTAGFVHGDIKPENYTVGYRDADGSTKEGMVIDFGTVTKQGQPLPDSVNGTMGYVDPAILFRSPDLRQEYHRSNDYYAMIRTQFCAFSRAMGLPELPDGFLALEQFIDETGKEPNLQEWLSFHNSLLSELERVTRADGAPVLPESFFLLHYIGDPNKLRGAGDIYTRRLDTAHQQQLEDIERHKDVSSEQGRKAYMEQVDALWRGYYTKASQDLHTALIALQPDDIAMLGNTLQSITGAKEQRDRARKIVQHFARKP